MSETGCEICAILEELRNAETYQHPSLGISFRKIQELPTSVIALISDQYYPGYTLVIAKIHSTELFHMPELESLEYCKDMRRVAKAIATTFKPLKMNYELLGNTVAHLHWHLIPRYDWDPNPKRPVWEHMHEPKILSPQEYDEMIAAIRREL